MTASLLGLCQSLSASTFWGLQVQQQVSSLKQAADLIQGSDGDKVGVTSARSLIERIQNGTVKKGVVDDLALDRVRSVLKELQRSLEKSAVSSASVWCASPSMATQTAPRKSAVPRLAQKDTYYSAAAQSISSPETSTHTGFLLEADPGIRGRLKNLFMTHGRDWNKPEDVFAVVTEFVWGTLKEICDKAKGHDAGFFDIPRSVLQQVVEVQRLLLTMENLSKKDNPFRGKSVAFFAALKASPQVQGFLRDINVETEHRAVRWSKNHIFSRDFANIVWMLTPST